MQQGLLNESHPNWVELLTGPLRFRGVVCCNEPGSHAERIMVLFPGQEKS